MVIDLEYLFKKDIRMTTEKGLLQKENKTIKEY